jgi:integral membrane protein
MKNFNSSNIGRLRLLGILEGSSLLILIFIAMPLKYFFASPFLVKVVGQIHGLLFLGFIFFALYVAIEKKWKFSTITWKVLLSCIIPFGTFYVDHKILSKLD